jgi:hypothetical protein
MMDELLLAAYHTVHGFPGGAKALAPRLGMAPSTLSNKVDPMVDTHKLSLTEALAAMLATGDFSILNVLAEQTGHVVLPAGSFGDMADTAVLELFARIQVEQGDVARALLSALEDGRFQPHEVEALSRETMEFIQAIQHFIGRIRGVTQVSRLRKVMP